MAKKESAKDWVYPNLDELKALRAEFCADLQAQEGWITAKEEYGNFYDGETWTEEEKSELEKRGQPATEINRIKPKVDSLCGMQMGLRVDTKAYPRGNREQEAEAISVELRNVEDDSYFDDLEAIAFEDMVIDGVAWYKMTKEWDGLTARDRITLVDNENVVIDRFTPRIDRRTGDLKGCSKVHEHVWMELSDAEAMFPLYVKEIRDAVNKPNFGMGMLSDNLKEYKPDQYRQPGGRTNLNPDTQEYSEMVDRGRKRIRVVTTYLRMPKLTRFITHSGGTVDVSDMPAKEREKVIETYPTAREWTEKKFELNTRTFIWNCIVEPRENIRPHDRYAKFPLIMGPGYVRRNKEMHHHGIVRQMMDPQRELNKRRSKMLHLLNVNQTWFEEGAFENEDKSRTEVAKPDGWVKYRKEFKVDNIRHENLAQSHFQILQETKAELDHAGVARELEGMTQGTTSGRHEALRQQQATQSVRKLFLNLRGARRRVGEYLFDEIRDRYPELKIKAIDVLVEEAPDTLTLQSETFDTLASLLMKGVPIPPDSLIKLSSLDSEMKKELLEKMKVQMEQQQKMQEMEMQLKLMAAQGKMQKPSAA